MFPEDLPAGFFGISGSCLRAGGTKGDLSPGYLPPPPTSQPAPARLLQG